MDYVLSFTDTTKSPFVVKPYTSNGPKTPSTTTPLYSGAVSANTSLVVLGKGAFDYGEPIQNNFLRLLENFANRTRPAYAIQGQLWYKNSDHNDISNPSDPTTRGLYIFTGSMWDQVITTNTKVRSNIDFNGFTGVNLANAVNPTDALNKQTGDALYVNVTGDSMSGTLNMSSNAITNLASIDQTTPNMSQALNVASGDSRYLRSAGGTMLGTIDMFNNKISNLQDASAPQDALNLRTAQSIFLMAGAGGVVDGGLY